MEYVQLIVQYQQQKQRGKVDVPACYPCKDQRGVNVLPTSTEFIYMLY